MTATGGAAGSAATAAVVPRARAGAPLILAAPATAAAAAVALPLLYVFLRAAGAGWDRYLEIVASPLAGELLLQTLLLVAGVVPLTAGLGISAAWLVTRTDLPGRRIWAVLAALPLVFPSYLAAFSLVSVIGPRGALQGWIERFGIEQIAGVAYGYSGALIALGFFTYPYVYLLAIPILRDSDPALEESARTLGAGPWKRFFEITLPQLYPAIRSGGLLVTLYTLSDFGAVSIVRYNTFTLGIYNAYRGLFDRTVAAALSTILIVLTLAFIMLETRMGRSARSTRNRPSRPPSRIPLGRWKMVAAGWIAAIVSIGVVIPAGTVLYWGVRGLLAGRRAGWELDGVVGSLAVAMTAAVAAVLFAIPVALWAARSGSRFARASERLVFAGYALPGLVIALGLVFFVTRFWIALYQTVALVVIACVIRFLPEAVAAIRSTLTTLSPTFEEAARSLGAAPSRVFRTITLPLLRPGLLAGGGLVFLTTMKELPATLILRPTGFETLATRIWSAVAEAFYSEAALPSLLLVLVSAVPMYLLVIRPVLSGRKA